MHNLASLLVQMERIESEVNTRLSGLQDRVVQGESGEGLIKVSGDIWFNINNIAIDREKLAAKTFDLATLEDLIAEAVNNAIREARNLLRQKLGEFLVDKCLRSLLISLAGAEQAVDRGSLSELARAFLADESIQTPESLREKAGLLALLNLMGIVETFYNTGDSVEHEFSDEGHGVPVAQGQPEAPFRGQDPSQLQSLSSLVSLLSGISGPDSGKGGTPTSPGSLLTGSGAIKEDALVSVLSAIPKLLGSKEGGIDPSILTALLKLMSSVPKIKTFSEDCKDPENTCSTGETRAIIDTKAEEEGNALNAACPGERGPSLGDTGQAHQSGSPGLDPRLITSLFNFLAGLDLSRSKVGGRQGKMAVSQVDAKKEARSDSTGITLAENGQSIVTGDLHDLHPVQPVPQSFSEFLRQPAHSTKRPASRMSTGHKPGIGIRRRWAKQSHVAAAQ